MPFKDPLNDYYKKIIKPTVQKCSLNAIRADAISGGRLIMDDIAESIVKADIIIADVTGQNPNVNYELGMAHALGKKVVIISQTTSDLPFDYKGVRAVIYDRTKVDWVKQLKTDLFNAINEVLFDTAKSYIIPPIANFLREIYINNNWGLKETFETRQKMNVRLNDEWAGLKTELDIIGFGLKSFRDARNSSVINKVKNGLKIRILTINPDSSFVKQREKDEKEVPGSIKKTIQDLKKWVDKLKSVSNNPDNIQLKFYNSLPLNFYWKQEDKLFVGPYLYGIGSQQTVTHEYQIGSGGYNFYIEYFNGLWNNEEFCKTDYSDFKKKK
ncbi:MAG: hypothetical protein HUJ68_07855, partial [Clostridia bacterium]|nr:hypothetical protein [Clostridia bacterium]